MDRSSVHRLRVGNWHPQAIKSLAVSRFDGKDEEAATYLAIGREDGEIDILSVKENFGSVAHIAGAADFKLQALCWSRWHEADESRPGASQRLFGISLRGFLFEVDLRRLDLSNVCDCYGGAAWALAASPRAALLAVGGEDGVLRLFSCDQEKVAYHKSLPTSGSRVLAVAYHPSQPHLFLGGADGIIRCLEESTGRALFRMTGDVHGGLSPSIWCLSVLSDGVVAAGDSRGQLHLFDGNQGVHLSGFATHTADILCLAVNREEDSIYASGIDGKVVALQRTSSGSQWAYAHSHRAHSHDVFSLALAPRPSTRADTYPGDRHLLLSAGLDGKVATYGAERDCFSRHRPFSLHLLSTSGVLPRQLVTADASHSMLACGGENAVDLWTLRDGQCDHLCALHLRGSDHLQSLALSQVGDEELVVVGSASSTKLFAVNTASEGKAVCRKLVGLVGERKVNVVTTGKNYLAGYEPATQSLCLYSLADLASASEEKEPKPQLSFPHEEVEEEEGDAALSSRLRGAVRSLVLSPCERFLAVLSAKDVITVYDLRASQGSSSRVYWRLRERLGHTVQSLAFLPSGSDNETSVMAVLFANNLLLLYDLRRRAIHRYLSSYATEMERLLDINHYRFPLSAIAALPDSASSSSSSAPTPSTRRARSSSRREEEDRSSSSASSGSLMLYGPLYCVHIDLSRPPPTANPRVLRRQHTSSTIYNNIRDQKLLEDDRRTKDDRDHRDRKRNYSAHEEEGREGNNFTVVELYRNVVYLGQQPNKELVSDNSNLLAFPSDPIGW
eukprot:gene10369-11479_t